MQASTGGFFWCLLELGSALQSECTTDGVGVGRRRDPRAMQRRLVGVARHEREDAQSVSAPPELPPQADVVVDLLPLIPEPGRFVNREFFARMKPGALFVNAGRGRTVDTDALVDALRAGRPRPALDVTTPSHYRRVTPCGIFGT